jgi:hypothetical protein
MEDGSPLPPNGGTNAIKLRRFQFFAKAKNLLFSFVPIVVKKIYFNLFKA